jgi:hypothetical protein
LAKKESLSQTAKARARDASFLHLGVKEIQKSVKRAEGRLFSNVGNPNADGSAHEDDEETHVNPDEASRVFPLADIMRLQMPSTPVRTCRTCYLLLLFSVVLSYTFLSASLFAQMTSITLAPNMTGSLQIDATECSIKFYVMAPSKRRTYPFLGILFTGDASRRASDDYIVEVIAGREIPYPFSVRGYVSVWEQLIGRSLFYHRCYVSCYLVEQNATEFDNPN